MGACITAVVVRMEKKGQILLYLLECTPLFLIHLVPHSLQILESLGCLPYPQTRQVPLQHHSIVLGASIHYLLTWYSRLIPEII